MLRCGLQGKGVVDGKEGREGKVGLGSGERLREEWDLFLDEKSWA